MLSRRTFTKRAYTAIFHAMEQQPEEERSKRFIDPVLEGLRGLLAGMNDRFTLWTFRNFGAQALGLHKGGEDDVLSEIMRSEVETHSQGLLSEDPDQQAASFRFFASLGAFKKAGLEPNPDDPDQHFLTQPLSGDDAMGCMMNILDSLPWNTTIAIRRHWSLPEVDEFELQPDAYGHALTSQQATVMAVALGGNIGYIQNAAENGKLVLPVRFMASTEEKEELAAALDTLVDFRETTLDERRQAITWAFDQIPRLFRTTFEQQQAIKEQFGNETDKM